MSNNDDPNTVGQSNNNDPNTVGQGSPSTTGSSGLADAGCHIEICRESFVSWTNGVPLDVDLMSEAGWRYIGDGKVQSCCCKITLKWEVSYDPWTQHAIHRPNCMFLKRQKDQAFIDGVQAAIPLNEEIDPVLDESEAEVRALQEDTCRQKKQLTCMVCEEKPRMMSYLPCKHMVCCKICDSAQLKCPSCKEPIEQRFITFLA